jgi:hypothetical protein
MLLIWSAKVYHVLAKRKQLKQRKKLIGSHFANLSISNGYILQLPHVFEMKPEAMAIAALKAMTGLMVSNLMTQELSARNMTKMGEHRSIYRNGVKT